MLDFSDKHAPYILASYAVAFTLLGAMILFSLIKAKRAKNKLESLQ